MFSFWNQAKAAIKKVDTLNGFTVGQVVYHKVDGKKLVIVSFSDMDADGPTAYCAMSSKPGDMGDVYLAELQAEEVK